VQFLTKLFLNFYGRVICIPFFIVTSLQEKDINREDLTVRHRSKYLSKVTKGKHICISVARK